MVAVCLAVVVALSLLATSPSLHRLIHKEADDSDHECAVTLFAHGQILHCLPELITALVVFAFVWQVDLMESVVLPGRAMALPLGRGPPKFHA